MSKIIPNTTQVPHIIIREWMPRLSDVELRVLLVVVDQTLGWEEDAETGRRKEKDWISRGQLVGKTGRSARHISNAVRMLVEEYQLIEAVDSKGRLLNTSDKRQYKFGKIFYRLTLHEPAVTLFDKKQLNEALSYRGTKGNTNGVRGTKSPSLKGATTKETHLQNIYILPDWLDKKAWAEWEEYRKERKKTLTQTSIKLQVEMLGNNKKDHIEIIHTSIRNGWTGLFPLKKQGQTYRAQQDDYARAHEKRIKEDEEKREFDEQAKNNDKLRELRAGAEKLAAGMAIK